MKSVYQIESIRNFKGKLPGLQSQSATDVSSTLQSPVKMRGLYNGDYGEEDFSALKRSKWMERRRKLSMGFGEIVQRYGPDAAGYQDNLVNLGVFVLFLGVCSCSLFVLINDLDTAATSSSVNLNNVWAFDENTLRSYTRGCIWFFCIVAFLLYNKLQGYHGLLARSKVGVARPQIADYSLILQCVPHRFTDQQIKQYLASFGGSDVISLLRIENPRAINERRAVLDLIEEYNYRLVQRDLGLSKPRGNWFGMKLLNAMGYLRNMDYYEKAIASRIKGIFITSQSTQDSQVDSIIATFSTVQMKNTVLQKLRLLRIPLMGQDLSPIDARPPQDLIYQNIYVREEDRKIRLVFGYLLSSLVALVTLVVICLLRNWSQELQEAQDNLIKENFIYYVFFITTLLFDLLVRPVLYILRNAERHLSYAQRGKHWMFKLYVYQLVNKLALFYSRNLQFLSSPKRFLQIFDYSYQWRNYPSSGGADIDSFFLMQATMFNLLELVAAWLPYMILYSMTWTPKQKQTAKAETYLNIASMYVNLLTFLTILLTFCSATPKNIFVAFAYFPVHLLIYRYLLIFFTGPPPKTEQYTPFFEYLGCAVACVSAFFFSTSFVNDSAGTIMGWMIGGLGGIAFVIFVLYHPALFDRFIGCLSPEIGELMNEKKQQKLVEKNSRQMQSVSEFEAAYEVDVVEDDVRAAVKMLQQTQEDSLRQQNITVSPRAQIIRVAQSFNTKGARDTAKRIHRTVVI